MTPVTVRLAELRNAKGWTIDHLAETSGVSRATIIRLEQGHTRQVHLDTLERLANALGVDAGYLILHDKRRAKED